MSVISGICVFCRTKIYFSVFVLTYMEGFAVYNIFLQKTVFHSGRKCICNYLCNTADWGRYNFRPDKVSGQAGAERRPAW